MTDIRDAGRAIVVAVALSIAALAVMLLTGCGGADNSRIQQEFIDYVNQSGDSFEIQAIDIQPTDESIAYSLYDGKNSIVKENTGDTYLITALVGDGTYEKAYETLAELVDNGDHYIFKDKSQIGRVVSFDESNPPFYVNGELKSCEWDPSTQTCTYTYVKDEGAVVTKTCTNKYDSGEDGVLSPGWRGETLIDASCDFSPLAGTWVSEDGSRTYTISSDGLSGTVTYDATKAVLTNGVSTYNLRAIYPRPYNDQRTEYRWGDTGSISCEELSKLQRM